MSSHADAPRDDKTGVVMSVGALHLNTSNVILEELSTDDGLRLTCSFGLCEEIIVLTIMCVDEDTVDICVNGRWLQLTAKEAYVHRVKQTVYRIFTVESLSDDSVTLAVEILPVPVK